LSLPCGPTEIRIAPASAEELRALFEGELRHRRVFVSGSFALQARDRRELVIERPDGARFTTCAEVVYLKRDDPGCGVGFELVGLDPSSLLNLERFVCEVTNVPSHTLREEAGRPRNLHERIRQLSLRERESVARQGSISERMALERIFGSSVWEALLQNPQLSIPEVARIATNGTLPIPLAAAIVSSGGWLASGEVRRALLSNPRVSGGNLERVLRATPRSELKQIAQLSPYRSEVRAAAKKLLGNA
jgi:hypothetical protein